MKDFLLFRKMVAPILIQIGFWIAIVVIIITAIIDYFHHIHLRVILEIIILGPLAARIVAELLILGFRIHDDIHSIRNSLRRSGSGSIR